MKYIELNWYGRFLSLAIGLALLWDVNIDPAANILASFVCGLFLGLAVFGTFHIPFKTKDKETPPPVIDTREERFRR